MAKITRTYLVDDIDGSTEDVENFQIALDGTSYELDLSAANSARLREKLERFVDAARPANTVKAAPKATPARRNTAVVNSNKQDLAEIRKWAKEAGLAISERGRISQTIRDAFDAR